MDDAGPKDGHRIPLRVSGEEHAFFHAIAELSGLTVTEFFKQAALEKAERDHPELAMGAQIEKPPYTPPD